MQRTCDHRVFERYPDTLPINMADHSSQSATPTCIFDSHSIQAHTSKFLRSLSMLPMLKRFVQLGAAAPEKSGSTRTLGHSGDIVQWKRAVCFSESVWVWCDFRCQIQPGKAMASIMCEVVHLGLFQIGQWHTMKHCGTHSTWLPVFRESSVAWTNRCDGLLFFFLCLDLQNKEKKSWTFADHTANLYSCRIKDLETLKAWWIMSMSKVSAMTAMSTMTA